MDSVSSEGSNKRKRESQSQREDVMMDTEVREERSIDVMLSFEGERGSPPKNSGIL